MNIQTILNKWVGDYIEVPDPSGDLTMEEFHENSLIARENAFKESLKEQIPQIEKEILEEIMFIEAPEVSEEMQKNIKEHSKYLVGWIEAKKHIINQLKSK